MASIEERLATMEGELKHMATKADLNKLRSDIHPSMSSMERLMWILISLMVSSSVAQDLFPRIPFP